MTVATEWDPAVAALAAYVGVEPDEYVAECVEAATDLVAEHVGAAKVPESVMARAVREVGAELFHRKSAPSGVKQFATEFGGTPLRIARDPMVAARPLLAPYLPGGFA